MSERRLATALLGRRLLARAARARRTGGRMLARSVAAARRPAMLPVITRLVPRPDRAAGAEPPRPGGEAADAPVPRPAGMSEFAARWVFGDGPAEGVPLPAVDVAPEVGDTAAPEPEQIGGQAPVAAADTARSTGAGGAAPPAPQRVPRGRVDEGAGDGGSPAPAGRRRFSRHPGAGAGEQPSPGKRVAASGQGRGEASAIPDARGPTTAPAGPSSGEPAPSHADEGPARAAGDRDPDSGHRARIVLRRPSKAGERARPRPRIRPRSEPELRPLPPARRGLLRRAADRVLGRRASPPAAASPRGGRSSPSARREASAGAAIGSTPARDTAVDAGLDERGRRPARRRRPPSVSARRAASAGPRTGGDGAPAAPGPRIARESALDDRSGAGGAGRSPAGVAERRVGAAVRAAPTSPGRSRVPVRVRRPAPADRTAAPTSAEGTEDVSTVSPTPARTRSATGSAPARAPAAAAPDVSASRPAFTTRPAVPIVARQAARAAPPPPEPPPPATGPDIDELYEQFAERLRRELLLERERIGDLLGDLHR